MTNEQIKNREKEILARAVALNNNNVCGCAEYLTEIEKYNLDELDFRLLINASLTYGEGYLIRNDKTNVWGRVGLEYSMKLGELRTQEVWKEQKDFFNKHAKIHWGVHTDYEGCAYNSLDWDC